MKYSNAQQAKAMQEACRKVGVSSHISVLEFKKDMQTWADRVIGFRWRKSMPIKRSYMYYDSLDMTFFFTENGEAVYSYAGYADKRDATEEKIVNAFRKANELRLAMEEALAKTRCNNGEM